MNPANRTDDDGGRFLTVDCVDFWLDGPGDHTVRPMSPERIAQVKAERDRIRQIEAEGKDKANGQGS